MPETGGPDGPVATEAAQAALRRAAEIAEATRECLGENLEGVYLHGSLAMGDFAPGSSDIDLLLAVRVRPLAREIACLRDLLLDRSGRPDPIELHVMAKSERFPWRHPAPFSWHYSEMWRAAMASEAAGGQAAPLPATDPDLAAHVVMLHARGRVLFGPPIAATFPEVPRGDFLDAVHTPDAARAAEEVVRDPIDGVLNLCRLALYACEGRLPTKREGAHWAMAARWAPGPDVVRAALEAYDTGRSSLHAAQEDLRSFARAWTAVIAGCLA